MLELRPVGLVEADDDFGNVGNFRELADNVFEGWGLKLRIE